MYEENDLLCSLSVYFTEVDQGAYSHAHNNNHTFLGGSQHCIKANNIALTTVYNVYIIFFFPNLFNSRLFITFISAQV